MSISSINYGSSVLGAQVRNINQQLTDLSTQLSTGKLSQNYSGMGTNEGFAIASRAQLSNIAAYTDTITNVNVNINLENTALQSLTTIRNTVQTGSATSSQDLNVNGQTVAQNTAAAQFGSMVGVLNTQSGNRYLFSGTAYNTQSVANAGDIINGTTTQAGLKTVMAERQAADLGANGMGRLVQSQAAGVISVAEDSATSPFGLKIAAVSSTLTGATVTGPSGSPVSFSVNLNGVNPKQWRQAQRSVHAAGRLDRADRPDRVAPRRRRRSAALRSIPVIPMSFRRWHPTRPSRRRTSTPR